MTGAADIMQGFRQSLGSLDGRIDYAEVCASPTPKSSILLLRPTVTSRLPGWMQVVDADSLQPVEEVSSRAAMLAVAVFFGSVRLIDNIALH